MNPNACRHAAATNEAFLGSVEHTSPRSSASDLDRALRLGPQTHGSACCAWDYATYRRPRITEPRGTPWVNTNGLPGWLS
jgi:hypothetical protein